MAEALESRWLSANQARWALVLLLLLAFALRVVLLDEAPVGLRYDELQNHIMAGRVVAGERPLYFSESWGHEPLYHYLQAAALVLVGESGWSLRLPSVFLGLLTIAATWLVARALLGRFVALLATAFLTGSFWAIFYSRVGLRVGAAAFFVALLVYFLWRMWQRPSSQTWRGWADALGAGLMLAAAFYTYFAGRVAPAIYLVFVLYLALFHWRTFRQIWHRYLLGIVVGGLLCVPLVRTIAANPASEARLELLNTALVALRGGDPLPVLDLTVRALGMYVWQGEQDWLYNEYGRPIFGILLAGFFIIGLAAAIWRWRQVRYALLLIWFLGGTGPAMIAPPAASITHSIVAQPVAYILLALGVAIVFVWISQRGYIKVAWGFVVLLFVVSSANAVYAYFVVWNSHDEVRELYQGGITAVAQDIEQTKPEGAVVIGGPYINYWHPWNAVAFDLTMTADVDEVRWFNPAGALVWPQAESVTFYFPKDPLAAQQFDPTLDELFLWSVHPLATEDDDFLAYRLATSAVLDDKLAAVEGETAVSFPPDLADLAPPDLPVNFGNRLQLLAVEPLQNRANPGEPLRFISYWEVLQADAAPLVAFTHLTSDGLDIWGQQDWLDVRMAGLQTGDRFAQIHQVTVSPETPAGAYQFQIGLYNPESLQRMVVVLDDSATRADRIWVGEAVIDE